jgi:hypothetical protein
MAGIHSTQNYDVVASAVIDAMDCYHAVSTHHHDTECCTCITRAQANPCVPAFML